MITDSIIYWSEFIHRTNIEWSEGSIFPSEMAAFLALCQHHNIRTIIESGRNRGYSTRILGEFSLVYPCRILSIDIEKDSVAASFARCKLESYPNVYLFSGNTFDVLPEASQHVLGVASLLVDGPKKHAANMLSYIAAIKFDIQLVAIHNTDRGSDHGKEFVKLFSSAFYYEDTGVMDFELFKKFKEWERQWIGDTPIYGRNPERSSLIMAFVSSDELKLSRLKVEKSPRWEFLKMFKTLPRHLQTDYYSLRFTVSLYLQWTFWVAWEKCSGLLKSDNELRH